MSTKMFDSKAYTVGWVSAIRPEFTAARQFLDEEYECPAQDKTDNNVYTVGRIGKHKVVLATLPAQEYGTASAATVVRDMVRSFPNIRIGLMVGIAGGAPTRKSDIRLGDVVISSPDSSCGTRHGGVFQYDFGKTIQNREFTPTGFLNQPPTLLRSAVAVLRSHIEESGLPIKATINEIIERKPRLKKHYSRPADETDILYTSSFLHQLDDQCCQSGFQIESHTVRRRERTEDEDDPAFHYGTIASANQLMKDAVIRDRLAEREGVLCFEMESAGLMNHFPCLVIRGICDYSDTHKNKAWQGFAAMAAAAYAKALLSRIAADKVELETKVAESLSSIQEDVSNIKSGFEKTQELETLRMEQKAAKKVQEWYCQVDAQDHHDDIRSRQPLDEATAEWLFNGHEVASRTFCEWRDKSDAACFLWATGDPAVGKTTVASQVIQHLRHRATSTDSTPVCRVGVAWTYISMAKSSEPQKARLVTWVLRSLIRTVLSQTPTMPAPAMDFVTKFKREGRSPGNAELLSCLKSICQVAYDDVYFIIDGLDEASHDACHELIGHLKELPPNARCMLTSRYNQAIQTALPLHSRIHIRANRRDAELYFAQELQRNTLFAGALRELERSKPGAALRAQEAIVDKTDESFLTAKLCLDELLKSSTPQEVEDALDDLPKSDELYQTIFRRLREKWELPGNRQWAKRILTLVCFSEIKFAPRHLLYMVGLDLNDPRVNHTNLLDPSLITSLCDGLVTIHVKTELVDLVHIQAKKFFIENQEDYFPDAHHDIAERYTAHVMAMSSIGFIENHDLGDMSKLAVKNLGPQVRQHLVQNLPGRFKNQRRMTSQSITATNAAALTSDPELRLSDERNEALFHKIAVMIDDPDCAAIICQVFCEISTWRPHQGTNPSEPNNALPTWKLLGWTRLHIAAAMGLVDVTRRFLDDTTLLNTVDFLGKTAVAVAVDRQHPDVAEVLVHAGAKVDIFSATGQTILLTAVGKGNVEFARRTLMSSESTAPWTRLLTGVRKEDKDLRLLLATLDGEATKVGRICTGSSVVKSSAAATALLLAADCGHLDILKILLAAAVPVDSRDGEGRTALHRAARRNDHAMVETLLDHSADVDAKSMFGQTAWTEIVAFPEHEDMVKLLVGRATNINVAHQDGVSSLYISAAGGHIALVSRLLSVGADPSIRTVYGWTPLHWGANAGHFDVAEKLLDFGADVNAISDTGQTPLELVVHSGSHHEHMRVSLLQNARIRTTAAYVQGDVRPRHPDCICTACQRNIPDRELAFACHACPPAPHTLCSPCLLGSGWCSDRGHAMQSVWAGPDGDPETIHVDFQSWEAIKDCSVAALLRKHGALTTLEAIGYFERSIGRPLSMSDWQFMASYGRIRSMKDKLDERLLPYLSSYESPHESEHENDNEHASESDGAGSSEESHNEVVPLDLVAPRDEPADPSATGP